MSLLDDYGIEEDPRFKRARQEAKVVFAYMFATAVFFFGTTAWGSITYDGSFNFILGLPTYLFITLVGLAVFAIIGSLISFYYIEDASLEAWRK